MNLHVVFQNVKNNVDAPWTCVVFYFVLILSDKDASFLIFIKQNDY
jgi:hypothetical protein